MLLLMRRRLPPGMGAVRIRSVDDAVELAEAKKREGNRLVIIEFDFEKGRPVYVVQWRWDEVES